MKTTFLIVLCLFSFGVFGGDFFDNKSIVENKVENRTCLIKGVLYPCLYHPDHRDPSVAWVALKRKNNDGYIIIKFGVNSGVNKIVFGNTP
ncbi:MAG: hypothetical protein AAB488_02170 [Patescibacteria group bacterium]